MRTYINISGIALGTAANEVQQDADTVGTALKTMSMRLRGSKTDVENAGLNISPLIYKYISKQSAQNGGTPEMGNTVGKILLESL